MSDEKIERIIATYRPVEGKPGYVWIGANAIVKKEILKEVYKEHFAENDKKE